MINRRHLLVSASLFALVTLLGSRWFGAGLYSAILLLAALIHLLVVTRWYPRLDKWSLAVHYGILLVTLVSVLLYVWLIVGPAERVPEILLAFFEYRLTGSASSSLLYSSIGLAGVITAAVLVLALLAPGTADRGEKIRAGFFAASIVAVACDYSILDPMSKVGATRPGEARSFVFAAGLEPLLVSLIVHFLVVLAIVTWRWRSERRAAILDRVPEEG